MLDFGNLEHEDRTMAYFMRLAVVVLFAALVSGAAGAPPATENEQKGRPTDQKADEKAEARPRWEVDDETDPDVRLLKAAKIGTEDDKLIDYLKKHSESDDDLLHIDRLVRQLGADDFEKREAASARLIDLGLIALPALREACKDKNDEVTRRAETCLTQVMKDSEENVPLAAVRVLTRRRSQKTLQALLQYLPYTVDEMVEEEIYYGLDAIALEGGKLRPPLLKVVQDPLAARRAVAGCIIGRVGNSDQRKLVRKLLEDKEPVVRLRSAQGLLASADSASIPALIGLLNNRSVTISWQAEELLRFAAGEDAPPDVMGDGTAERREKCHSAWEAWWQKSEPKLDLACLSTSERRPGLLLVCESDGLGNGCVSVCGCDGVPRWRKQNLKHPADARMLHDGHLLLAERENGRVVECEVTGHVVWEKRGIDRPSTCQRHNNGTTLVTTDLHRLLAFTSEGKEVRSLNLQRDSVPDKYFLRHVQVASNGSVLGLAGGRRDRKFVLLEFQPNSGEVVSSIVVNDLLPEGLHYVDSLVSGKYLLVASGGGSATVLQIDREGKTEWHYDFPGILHAAQLRNGHTLLCLPSSRHGRVSEIDAGGNTLFEWCVSGDPCRVNTLLSLVQFGFGSLEARDSSKEAMAKRRAKGLSSKFSLVRQRSCEALAELGPASLPEVPSLAKALASGDPETRIEACHALEVLEPRLVPETLSLLKHKNSEVRVAAVSVIRHSSNREDAVSDLLDAFEDDNAEARRSVLLCLGIIRPVKTSVVPAIVRGLEDRDSEVRISAAMALGDMGGEAKAAVPSLIRALNGSDVKLRHWSALALGDIGPVDERVVPALLSALANTKDLGGRSSAACALGKIGPKASSAVSTLISCLGVTDRNNSRLAELLRTQAAWALGRIGSEAKPAVPVLAKMAANKRLAINERLAYLDVLASLGKDAAEAISILEGLLDEKDDVLRKTAAESLKKIK
jgi:HEAT repeat protein